MQLKMLKTMSKIKKVCAMIMVPRVFRGAGCATGKFHRLKFDVIQKVQKSTSSDDMDPSKNEEGECKKIIEYAFAPAEPYRYVDKTTNTELAQVSMSSKPQEPEDERLRHEKDEKIIAEWLKLNLKSNEANATLLEDLKSKSLSEARANVLLRVRNLDTILAAVEKKGKEINIKTAEGKDVVVVQANVGEDKDEIKPHGIAANVKEHLVQTVSLTEDKALNLQATTADQRNEDKMILAPKLEHIGEVPLVEAAPNIDIISPTKDSILNATRFDRCVWHGIQSQFIDEIAQKYMHTPVNEIDRQLVKELCRLDYPLCEKIANMSTQEEQKLEPEVIKNEPLPTQLNADSKIESKNEFVNNSDHISSKVKSESIKQAEQEIKIDRSASVQQLVKQVNISENKEIPSQENVHRDLIGPASDGRVALRDSCERSIEVHNVDKIDPEQAQCEHKQPSHLFRKALVDAFHTTEPTEGLLVREYPVPMRVLLRGRDEPRYVTDPGDRRTFDSEEWENPTALHYSQTIKHSTVKEAEALDGFVNCKAKEEKQDGIFKLKKQLKDEKQDCLVNFKQLPKEEKHDCFVNLKDLPKEENQDSIVNLKELPKEKKQDYIVNLKELPKEKKQDGIVNSKKLPKEEEPTEPTRAAVEMAHTFIQAQPCEQPMQEPTKEHERKAPSPFTADDFLPEINLNDKSISLTELLRRVRERNRILYCREVRKQMERNIAELNPEGKCGDKKPPCPPPPKTCPPSPPCPKPECPPKCPPPKESKCPQPKCPPPSKCASRSSKKKDPCGKKDPCAKFKGHETITLVLHLGSLVYPAQKVILPVLATNLLPAPVPSSEQLPAKGSLGNLINQKLELLKDILRYIIRGRPYRLNTDMILLRLNRTRDYTPWSPIPSWPYPIINRKRPLQCPKDGCPVDPPVNPAPKFQRPCPNRPCLDFPRRPGS